MVIKGRCLECGCIAMGLPLIVDPALALIRFFKAKINWGAQKETVIVCEEKKCVDSFLKRLNAFHKEIAVFVTVGVILGLVIIFVSPSIRSMLSGLIITVFVSLFSLVKYCPNVEGKFHV